MGFHWTRILSYHVLLTVRCKLLQYEEETLNECQEFLSISDGLLVLPELECERECSRGEDYRLLKLTITDYSVSIGRVALLIESISLAEGTSLVNA